MGIEFYRALANFMEMTRGSIYIENEDCVKKVINTDYWNAKEKIRAKDSESNLKYIILGSFVISVFLITLIVLGVYYKNKIDAQKDDKDKAVTKE